MSADPPAGQPDTQRYHRADPRICRARVIADDDDGFDWSLWCARPFGHDGMHEHTSGMPFADTGYQP